MANVTLLFLPTQAAIDSITLDASLSETHGSDVEVTDHPVEVGANISDHIRPKPPTLSIEGLVSNTPIPPAGGDGTPLHITNGNTQVTVDIKARSTFQETRAGSAYQQLLALKDSGQLFSVVTGLRTYDNMAFTTLTVPRDAKSGQTLKFTAALKQVIQVASKVVKVVAKASGKDKLGKVAAKPAPEKSQSLADSLLHGIKNLLPGAKK